MATKTKSVDGKEHPASDFAYVGDPNDTETWHLPDFDSNHARLAMDMFGRTQGMSDAKKKSAAASRIARKAKGHGEDTSNFEKAHCSAEMADFDNQWVEIFRAGDYGKKGEWKPEDLDEVVQNFADGVWTPPAVYGHPEEDSPAHGWVSELKREGDSLLARFTQVSAELESSVQNGRFPNRSAAFYLNPKGDGPVLRHVGFLGATPPEVKGLEPIQFAEFDGGDVVAIDFNEEAEMDPKVVERTVMESVRKYFGEIFGRKDAGHGAATFTEEQMNAAVKAATAPMEKQIADLSKKFDENVTASRKAAEDASAEGRRAKATAFVERMKAAGKWIPAFSEAGLDVVLENLAASGTKVKFGETGKEKEAGAFEQLCSFIEQQPKIVPTGAITVKKGGRAKVVRFNETRDVSVDPKSVVELARAEEIFEEGKGKIEFGEALRQARHELAEQAS